MLEQIVHLAEAIVQPSETERPLLTALCAAAGAEIEGRLRDGISPEDCGDAFPCAAAFTAAADLAAGEGGAASFSAGDLSVNLGGGQDRARRAEALRQTAERLMEPFVRAAGLWAQGVEG